MAVENIRITGVRVGLRAKIIDPEDECSITLIGLASELNEINVNTLEAHVDIAAWLEDEEVEELEPGYYRIPLSVNLSEDSTVVWEGPDVQVHITEVE